MTRENKLALVIGFGLLLLAGILVSDHLSAQQRVEEDPLVATKPHVVLDPSILQPKNTPAPPPVQEQQATRALANTTPPPPTTQRRSEIVIGGTPAAAVNTPTPVQSANNIRVHYVKSGENLTQISKKYYGTGDRWEEIARKNNISDPGRLTVGTRLVVETTTIASANSNPRGLGATPVRKAVDRTTTVKDGDTLSSIAKRELGSSKKWHALWKANESILPNPNMVAPGMTLRLPATISPH